MRTLAFSPQELWKASRTRSSLSVIDATDSAVPKPASMPSGTTPLNSRFPASHDCTVSGEEPGCFFSLLRHRELNRDFFHRTASLAPSRWLNCGLSVQGSPRSPPLRKRRLLRARRLQKPSGKVSIRRRRTCPRRARWPWTCQAGRRDPGFPPGRGTWAL